MRVDAPMAVIAGAAAEIGEVVGPMTVLATKALVATNECKSGDGHVIKNDLGPTCRTVAVAALVAVFSLVHIVFAVAVVAGLSDRGKVVAVMTAATTNAGVCAR